MHAEFTAVLSSMFFEPGDQLIPGHLLQSLDLNTQKHWYKNTSRADWQVPFIESVASF